MDKTIEGSFNYTLTKATDEVLAKIYAEAHRIREWRTLLNWRGKILKSVQKEIPELLRNYRGKFSDQVEVWTGHNIVPSILRNEFASCIA